MLNNTKYTQYKTQQADPAASSMIETLRAIGYNIETAVADIVDNAISANAKNIWINFEWKGAETWLSIMDFTSILQIGVLMTVSVISGAGFWFAKQIKII